MPVHRSLLAKQALRATRTTRDPGFCTRSSRATVRPSAIHQQTAASPKFVTARSLLSARAGCGDLGPHGDALRESTSRECCGATKSCSRHIGREWHSQHNRTAGAHVWNAQGDFLCEHVIFVVLNINFIATSALPIYQPTPPIASPCSTGLRRAPNRRQIPESSKSATHSRR